MKDALDFDIDLAFEPATVTSSDGTQAVVGLLTNGDECVRTTSAFQIPKEVLEPAPSELNTVPYTLPDLPEDAFPTAVTVIDQPWEDDPFASLGRELALDVSNSGVHRVPTVKRVLPIPVEAKEPRQPKPSASR